jgi:hypothetical protein
MVMIAADAAEGVVQQSPPFYIRVTSRPASVREAAKG